MARDSKEIIQDSIRAAIAQVVIAYERHAQMNDFRHNSTLAALLNGAVEDLEAAFSCSIIPSAITVGDVVTLKAPAWDVVYEALELPKEATDTPFEVVKVVEPTSKGKAGRPPPARALVRAPNNLTVLVLVNQMERV